MLTATVIKKRVPDEVRPFAKGQAEVFKLDEWTMGRGTFEPGWRWSECVKPVVGTETCQVHHVGYVVSGRMEVQMAGGGTTEVGAGDFMNIPPGHDAWVVGDEPCVVLEVQGAAEYAKK